MNTANDPSQKRRVFTRVAFDTQAVVHTPSGDHECKLIDLSLKGALVQRPLPWAENIGAPCHIVIKLADDGEAICMTGEIAHVEQGRLGIHCTEIDLESITSLRRLVELNLGDEAALQREISAMIHMNDPD